MDKTLTLVVTIDHCDPKEAFSLYNAACALHGNADVEMSFGRAYPSFEDLNEDSGTTSAAPAPAPTAPVAAPAPSAAPAPAPTPTAVAPAAAPASAPTPATSDDKPITFEGLSVAGSWLVDEGKMDAVLEALSKYGVQAMTQLQEQDYPAFAADLRALGAKI